MPKQRRTHPAPKTKLRAKAPAQQKPRKTLKPARPARAAKPAKPARPSKAASPKRSAGPPRVPKPARKPASKPLRVTPAPAERKPLVPRGRARSAQAAPQQAEGPSTHDRAVELFERGFQALQQRQFARAGELLSSVVNGFTDEKELQERARVFLAICERQSAGREVKPRSFEERLNAAIITVNRGALEEALALLQKLEGEQPDHDHVQYMLAVACAGLGDTPRALAHLQRAIGLAAENQIRAAQDPDLDRLRQDPGYAAIAEALSRRRTAPPPKKR